MNLNFKEIDKKWQAYWKKNKTFEASSNTSLPKYYILDMFPYPSGAGLHVGHPLGYIASDIYARFKRAEGYNVLHPMGFDSFGLPAEQYAIETGNHPALTTKANKNRYRKQLTKLGLSFDWEREICTTDPDFYKWTQWIFSELFSSWYDASSEKAKPIKELVQIFENSGNHSIKNFSDFKEVFSAHKWKAFDEEKKEEILQHYRLTYLKEGNVNWCPALGTVLANDEIKEGKSQRGGHPVYQKKMKQWYMRITPFAQRLLEGLKEIDWSESLKESQRNWIGRSTGATIFFEVKGHDSPIEIFSTRPETFFGASFIALAPEHPLIEKITPAPYKEKVNHYKEQAIKKNEKERQSDTKTISGVFTGAYCLDPFNKKEIPIYIADYVLAGYGTGALMGVPAHDKRDHHFAKKFELPILPVISSEVNSKEQAYEEKMGKCMNSFFLNGLDVEEASKKMIQEIQNQKLGNPKVQYRLRDAVFSRQRYWGEPIPVYYKGKTPKLLPSENLPLALPHIDKYLPTSEGEPPLKRAELWAWDKQNNSIKNRNEIDQKEIYPIETNTMPTWAGAAWYFIRYMSPHIKNRFVEEKAEKYWRQVDLYVGGTEHATGHLLYSRFWYKFLKDRDLVNADEPFAKLINQGMILGNSALIARDLQSNQFISAGLVKENQKVQYIYVDIHLLKNEEELDIEKFKAWRKEFEEASFVFEKEEKFLCKRQVEKMSKSKYNVVNPDEICNQYGADTLRLYEMFLGPIEQSKPWNTKGISGVYHFLKKFWNLFHAQGKFYLSTEKANKEELKILHKLIKKVREDIENFSFNTSVSAFMITTNELISMKCQKEEILRPLVVVLAPFAPHLGEELWEKMGHQESVSKARFPGFDEKYLIEDSFEYPIMINGKLRFKLSFALDKKQEEIKKEVLDCPRTKKYLEGKPPKNIIIVPGKIINLVV